MDDDDRGYPYDETETSIWQCRFYIIQRRTVADWFLPWHNMISSHSSRNNLLCLHVYHAPELRAQNARNPLIIKLRFLETQPFLFDMFSSCSIQIDQFSFGNSQPTLIDFRRAYHSLSRHYPIKSPHEILCPLLLVGFIFSVVEST